jgi:hypothetical protein
VAERSLWRVGECGRRAAADRAIGADGEVLEVFLQHHGEGVPSGDQKVLEAFAAQGADPAFRNGVRSRCPNRGADDPDVGAGEYRVEGGGELGISVADQEPKPGGMVAGVHE